MAAKELIRASLIVTSLAYLIATQAAEGTLGSASRQGAEQPPAQTPERLPLELGRMQDELKRIDERLVAEPPENRKMQLCGTAENLVRLTSDIAKAPLLEMTQQNFKAWRAATAATQERAEELQTVCRQTDASMFPVEEKYEALKQRFADLLRIRQ